MPHAVVVRVDLSNSDPRALVDSSSVADTYDSSVFVPLQSLLASLIPSWLSLLERFFSPVAAATYLFPVFLAPSSVRLLRRHPPPCGCRPHPCLRLAVLLLALPPSHPLESPLSYSMCGSLYASLKACK